MTILLGGLAFIAACMAAIALVLLWQLLVAVESLHQILESIERSSVEVREHAQAARLSLEPLGQIAVRRFRSDVTSFSPRLD